MPGARRLGCRKPARASIRLPLDEGHPPPRRCMVTPRCRFPWATAKGHSAVLIPARRTRTGATDSAVVHLPVQGVASMTMTRPTLLTVLIADRDTLTRKGLSNMLASDRRFNVVGEVAANVLDLAQRLQPTPRLIVLDPNTGGRLDLQLIADLRRIAPTSYIVVFTAVTDPCAVLAAMRAGARAYLIKVPDDRGAFLCETLVYAGRWGAPVTDPALIPTFEALPAGALDLRTPGPAAATLTPRERETLPLVARGISDQEIGKRLGISATTVRTHVYNARLKLGASDRAELSAIAVEQGLI